MNYRETYNTRTLAACEKRLRWMRGTLPAMPQADIVWRFREGFRLQVAGEAHEPGGCLAFGDAHERIDEITRALDKGQAEQDGWDCLHASLECAPQGFTDADLRHLSIANDLPEEMRWMAIQELCRRHGHEHPDFQPETEGVLP